MTTERPQPQRLRVGEGKISGYLSIFLALISLGAVICFHFPEYFTTAEFRAVYPVDFLRWVLLLCLVFAFGFALTSFLLSGKSRLGLIGVVISVFAIVLGGNTVEIDDFNQSIVSISLDWLLIDILVLSAIFIPVEFFLPKRTEQTKFHLEWKTDLVYFAVGHLLVQFTAVAIKVPAESIFGGWGLEGMQSTVSSWPFLVQLALAMLVADLFQYAAHRAFHANRFLWRFHAVHHSIRAVDWLAGSRLHLVDILVTRAFSYIPLYVLGFSMPVILRLRGDRRPTGRRRPCQHPHPGGAAQVRARFPAVPPLAPLRRSRVLRQEFRHPLPADRPTLRYLPPTRRRVARDDGAGG